MEIACTSGLDRPTPWGRSSTAAAPTSRSSPRSPTGSSSASSTTTGPRRRVDLPGARGAGLARLPAPGRCRVSGTATGCTARTTRRRACGATRRSCCSTRTRRRSTGTSGGTRRCSPTGSAAPDSCNDADSAPFAQKSVVINPFFDWERRPATAGALQRVGDLRGARQGHDSAASRHSGGRPRHVRRGWRTR